MLSAVTVNLIYFLSALIGYLVYRYKKRYNYWRDLGVPYIGASGDIIFETTKNKAQVLQDRYNALSRHPYGGIFQASKPYLLLRDPEIVRTVLIKDFSHFTDRGMVFHEELDPLTAHIFNLGGQRWKNIRTKLVPTFSSGKLKTMFPLMEQCIHNLNGYLDAKLARSDEFEVRELMLKFATDVIGTCAFGFNCNAIADGESEFRAIGRKLAPNSLKFRFRQVLRSIHPDIIRWLGWKGFNREVEDFFMGVTRETIRYREQNQDKRNDFMQLMINLQHEERNAGQGDNDAELLFADHIVAAHVFVFFVAGFETTATTLANCLYELALNPEVAEKLQAEIQRVLDSRGGKLDYDALKEMRYMECALEETLRKYPPVGFLDRVCTKAYELPNSSLLIKENLNVVIPVYSLHYDPQYYPEPQRFDPDRFNDENRSKIVPGTYLPFGDGPRICIGMRFAIMEAKAALTVILKNYTVHPTSKTQIPLVLEKNAFILRPEKGIHLKFQKRAK